MQIFTQLSISISLSIISKLLLFLLFHCLALFESPDAIIAFLSEESAQDKILLKAIEIVLKNIRKVIEGIAVVNKMAWL